MRAATMTDDPWEGIAVSGREGPFPARRVSAGGRWNFFWARDHDGNNLLLLLHAPQSVTAEPLPKLKGVSVELASAGGERALVVRLEDAAHKDIFRTLVLDLIAAAEKATDEAAAVAIAVRRTWRWHHLLRGGASGKLGEDEQKGLLGELIVIEHRLRPHVSPARAMDSWVGPLGAAKDFRLGRLALEAKASRGSAIPFVRISSEQQLSSADCDALYLHVVELTRDHSGGSTSNSVSIASVVEALRRWIGAVDPDVLPLLDAKLASAGVDDPESYEEDRWVLGRTRLFRVTDDFPRVTPENTAQGVRGVKYSVDLSACEPFAVLGSVLDEEVRIHGHA